MNALAERHRGLLWLSARETHRVLKLWTQTVVAPILSSLLFILVFGLSLGGRIRQVDGVPYEVFIVPGLITMAMIQATYANNSASVFQARFDRYLNDVLAAPMRGWEINLALSLGGVFYSVDVLPSPWHELSHLNPIFYLLNAVRYGFLGTSDVSVLLSLAVTGGLAAAVVAWSAWLFRTGHRLKP